MNKKELGILFDKICLLGSFNRLLKEDLGSMLREYNIPIEAEIVQDNSSFDDIELIYKLHDTRVHDPIITYVRFTGWDDSWNGMTMHKDFAVVEPRTKLVTYFEKVGSND